MARPLRYPFNTLEKAGDWFASEPKRQRGRKEIDRLRNARASARVYASWHLHGGKIEVTEIFNPYRFVFVRVAG